MCSDPNSTEANNLMTTGQMTTMLQKDYQSTFANNQQILGNLTTTLNNAIAKPQGFTSGQMSAMRTGAMDTTANQFSAAKSAAGAAAARYGGGVASGVTGQLMGGIAAQEAGQESQEQNQITQADAQQKQANYWQGIAGLQGVASAYNPTGYANAATSSSDATTAAAKEVSAEKQQGMDNAMSMVKMAGGMTTGGLSTGLSALGGSK